MIPEKHIKVLRLLCDRLEGVNWVLTGSTSFAIQGLPLIPHDIDIQADVDMSYEIEKRLAEFVTQPICFSGNEKIRSQLGRLFIDGIQVEIIGGIEKQLSDGTWETPPDIDANKRYFTLEDLRIPVLSLRYEEDAYRKMGRIERADQIKDRIEQSG
jgi:hypothetical protein